MIFRHMLAQENSIPTAFEIVVIHREVEDGPIFIVISIILITAPDSLSVLNSICFGVFEQTELTERFQFFRMIFRWVIIFQDLDHAQFKIIFTILCPKLLQPLVRALSGRKLETNSIKFCRSVCGTGQKRLARCAALE